MSDLLLLLFQVVNDRMVLCVYDNMTDTGKVSSRYFAVQYSRVQLVVLFPTGLTLFWRLHFSNISCICLIASADSSRTN